MAKIIIDPFDGSKHLPGSFMCSFVTLCGEVDAFEQEGPGGKTISKEGKESTGLPDCVGCIDTARLIFSSITKRDLNKCK